MAIWSSFKGDRKGHDAATQFRMPCTNSGGTCQNIGFTTDVRL